MLLKKELLREFIRENNLTTARDIQNALKDVFASTLQEMPEAELDEHLGYTMYDYKNKTTRNARNGTSPKKVLSDSGEIDLAVPRDRDGEFEPKAFKKHQTDVSGIEDKILGMYAKGITTRDISADLGEIYEIEASHSLISRITDEIIPIAQEWQNNWAELSTFFKYPGEIRKMIYTTNAMESFNRQLRKVTKSRSIFPSDASLLKMLYLATQDVAKKWTQNLRGWSQILAQLSIHFEDRFDESMI